jgi:hypothetical protein
MGEYLESNDLHLNMFFQGNHNHNTPFHDHGSWHQFPKVDMKIFDGPDSLSWVTQMKQYFSLHGIIDDIHKLKVWVLYFDLDNW